MCMKVANKNRGQKRLHQLTFYVIEVHATNQAILPKYPQLVFYYKKNYFLVVSAKGIKVTETIVMQG